ncbi:hypothetical protein ANAPC1_00796 [Anaplasma phagocytophilum]|uniref:Uncharacterized protein n=1 Tax=Anaplasma phagocytophilum TaxID=948 RepID=A0AA45ZHL5_ANAPH|nr:hypothetical protein ANAPC1_00796 [Anaplasma phagocytophilum]
MESKALSVDSRIVNSEEASFWKSLTETAVCVLYPKFIYRTKNVVYRLIVVPACRGL